MISVGTIKGVPFRVDTKTKSLVVESALGELNENDIRVLKIILNQSLLVIAQQREREILERNGQLSFV